MKGSRWALLVVAMVALVVAVEVEGRVDVSTDDGLKVEVHIDSETLASAMNEAEKLLSPVMENVNELVKAMMNTDDFTNAPDSANPDDGSSLNVMPDESKTVIVVSEPQAAEPIASSPLLMTPFADYEYDRSPMMSMQSGRRDSFLKGFDVPSIFGDFFKSAFDNGPRPMGGMEQIVSISVDDATPAFSPPPPPPFSNVFSRLRSLMDDMRNQVLSGMADSDEKARTKGGCPLRMACGIDMQTFCSSQQDDFDSMVSCLLSHSDVISSVCNELVQRRWGESTDAAETEQDDFDSMVSCLLSHSDVISSVCNELVQRRWGESTDAVETEEATPTDDTIPAVSLEPASDEEEEEEEEKKKKQEASGDNDGPCATEITVNCANKPLGVETLACLSDHADALGEKCSKAMKELPIFFCAADIMRECPAAAAEGPAAIARCLINKRDQALLSKQCLENGLGSELGSMPAAPLTPLPPAVTPATPTVAPQSMIMPPRPVSPPRDFVQERPSVETRAAKHSTIIPAVVGFFAVAVFAAVGMVVIIVRRVRRSRARQSIQTVQLVNPSEPALQLVPLDVQVGLPAAPESNPVSVL